MAETCAYSREFGDGQEGTDLEDCIPGSGSQGDSVGALEGIIQDLSTKK